MSVIGPRLGNHRVPMSFSDEELLALGAYRFSVRELRSATTDESRAVNERASAVAMNAAYRRTAAAHEAHSRALEHLNATLQDP